MQIDMENTRTIESRRQSTMIWLINSTVASSSGRGEWRLSGARSRDTVGQRSVNRLRHRCQRSTSIKRGRQWTIDCIYHQLWAAVSAAYSALLSSSYFERINDDDELQASPTNLHWGSVAIYTAAWSTLGLKPSTIGLYLRFIRKSSGIGAGLRWVLLILQHLGP